MLWQIKIAHWWYGCAGFNQRWPSWKKRNGFSYPSCGICGSFCWWMWGYKNRAPDLVAQKVQGAMPTVTDQHYSREDGWIVDP